MSTNNKKKKKGGAGVWALVAAAILVFNMLDGLDEWQVRRFFLQLQHNPTMIIAFATVILVGIIVLVSLAANRRRAADASARSSVTPSARGGGSSAQHSHDRIQGYTAGGENGYEHWKKQLDGFLAAGLIDRKEYMALLERRKTNY